jgi:hypothetical protein
MAIIDSKVPVAAPAARPSLLTAEQVEEVVGALPIQGRIMLRLLLLQYLDVTREEVEYMAADRPDPRFAAGGKPITPYLSQETIQSITDRAAHYRAQIRHRRERASLQAECLRKQIPRTETMLALAERLLASRFGMTPDEVQLLKKQARAAVPKPEIRELEARWQRNEISEDDYKKRRLAIELQSLIRKADRERRRLDLALRELELANYNALQDHEIAQIWGIPASSLAGRKVKHLQQYLQAVQSRLTASGYTEAGQKPVDLWKETFLALSTKPAGRTAAPYDGMEGTEAGLIEKLTFFAAGTFPEEKESQFWVSITTETNHSAEHGSRLKSLFSLQRLSAIFSEMDLSPETLEQELMERVSPKIKDVPQLPAEEQAPQLGEMAEHVLKSFTGEDHTDTRARR